MTPLTHQRPPRLLFLVTVDWFFASHFLARACAAQRAGYEVLVMTHLEGEHARLRAAGLVPIHWQVRRRGLNPLTELRSLWQVVRAYRRYQPDLVHQIALKPIIYGTLAARLSGVRHLINAPVGMGFVFTSKTALARVLRPLLRLALRWLLNPPGSRVVFENADDRAQALAGGLVREQAAVLIRGAGVDVRRIRPIAEPPGIPKVLLVARMLWDKGVGEFVAAAHLLRARGVRARYLLIGGADPDNRACIEPAQLQAWCAEGVVEWLGHRHDIAALMADAHIVALPSYREGLPKALLEALAAGRPIVATDVPGCREAVIAGQTGLLVPARDPVALADALAYLLECPRLRHRFGNAGRRLAEQAFTTEQVERATLALYSTLLGV
ncbi:MAG: glycosyltransferase family 4 protein [Halochromatium sp.]|uniref:glycosyltransferase family 4 protein n=1 Tax=Halochromatium sp. TaxID=2049430 RepID=UPI00397C4BA6